MRGLWDANQFTTDAAYDVLEQVCRRTGHRCDDARLLRLGQNASYALPDAGLVVRIARSREARPQVERELAIARWLAGQGFPAVRVADEFEQPLEVDGRLATFWRLVPESDQLPTLTDVAGLLRLWRELPPPPFEVPLFEPLEPVPGRLDQAEERGEVPAGMIAFLRRHCAELAAAYGELTSRHPRGLVHGDAHVGNVLIDQGRPVLLDFETVGLGPQEWDLLPAAIALARFGLPEVEYAAFVKACGYDVREWDGYALLRAVRELAMVVWLMQNVSHSPQIAEEFAVRARSLEEGDRDRRWHVF